MTVSRIFLSAACVVALASPAAAQMYPGQGVSVNPAVPNTTGTVVYRGGTYVRLPPLLQPGQPMPGQAAVPIELHMPAVKPRREARKPKARDDDVAAMPGQAVPAEEPAEASTPAAAPTAAVVQTALPPAPKPVRSAVTQQQPQRPAVGATADNSDVQQGHSSGDGASSIPFSFGGPAVGPAQRQPAPPPPSPRSQIQHSAPAIATAAPAAQAPPERVAAAEPAPVETIAHAPMSPSEEPANLAKQSEILFPHNGTDPSASTLSQLKQLAGTLNSALNSGARKIQLDAFGGAPGDKSSDARRVSLKRALVIRQLLIDDGVPASRIDVRAMGGIDDNGNADRVDVYVRVG